MRFPSVLTSGKSEKLFYCLLPFYPSTLLPFYYEVDTGGEQETSGLRKQHTPAVKCSMI